MMVVVRPNDREVGLPRSSQTLRSFEKIDTFAHLYILLGMQRPEVKDQP